ncbi:MAG: SDR family NAD(P)-dependent oxidoreductase, partial [Parvibaculum sp.]
RPVFELNFMGTVNCLEALITPMRARKAGRIAIVASLAGYFGLPTSAIYGGSKAALINMAEALRPDLALDGIKLQIVNPGFVKTPLTDKNEFPMPFLMEVDDAVDAFYRGLQSDRFEITFPRRFSLILRLVQMLPYRLSLALTAMTMPKRAKITS